MRDEGHLPQLSDRLGDLTRTNSESILGAIAPDRDGRLQPRASRSPRRSTPTSTPTSSRCRYGKGSNAMALLQTVLTDGDGRGAALAHLAARDVARSGAACCDLYDLRHWSERTVIALVMQTPRQLDHDLHASAAGYRPAELTSQQGHGEPNPTWIPVGQRGRPPDGRDRSAASPAARSASRSTCR